MAQLEWIDDQPYHVEYGDRYFSDQGGLEETQYVFLDGNRLTEGFKTASPSKPFTVAELGFGTGLNFLATALLWLQHAPNQAQLEFYSIEKHPLDAESITRAIPWTTLTPLKSSLLMAYPEQPTKGIHSIPLTEQIILHLGIGDVADVLPVWQFKANAWFLDGHSPSKNPDMWSQQVCDEVFRLTQPTGTFATFAAAGFVQQNLTQAGFEISKRKGFGTKREMLVGSKPA